MLKIFDIGRWVALFSKNWLNPFVTVFFNFYYLPLSQAIKLPIFFYGRPRLLGLKGKVIVEGKVKTGMVKLNFTQHNPYYSMPFEYINDGGTVVFRGSLRMPNGGRFLIFGGGVVTFGDDILISSAVIACQKKITLGDRAWLIGGSKIFDTDFHFFHDRTANTISTNALPVVIGNDVSIFTESFIGKGVNIPDHTIVAARTNLIKMPSNVEQYSIIGGSPVRVLKKDIEKLQLDWRGERALADYFITHPELMKENKDKFDFLN